MTAPARPPAAASDGDVERGEPPRLPGPAEPTEPAATSGPAEPDEPTEPDAPAEPIGPDEREEPAVAGGSAEPTGPDGPDEREEPTGPRGSAEAAEPVTPGKSEADSGPIRSAESEDSDEDVSAGTATAAERTGLAGLARPTVPAEPADPPDPAGSAEPIASREPDASPAPAPAAAADGRLRRVARLLRLWYGRILLGTAGVWLAYAVFRWLVSGRWHWSLLLDATPPLFLVGIPLLLMLASAASCGRRRPWAAGLSLAALLLALTTGSGLNWPALWRDQQPVPPGALHVVSLNTQYWAQATSVDRLYEVLHRQRADVYLLQEHVVWNPDLGEEGYSRLNDDARLRAEFPDYHIARQGELLTISRFPIVAQPPVGPGIALEADPDTTFEQTFDRDKVFRTDLRVRGQILSVYNVHITVQVAPDVSPLSAGYDSYLQRKFRWRQEELRGLEEDIARNDHPMVIGGDFNCHAAMRDLDGVRDLADDALRANTDFLPLSWKFPAPAGFDWDSFLNRPLPFWRVDWVFTAGDVDVHRYEFLPNDGVSEHRLQDVWLSL